MSGDSADAGGLMVPPAFWEELRDGPEPIVLTWQRMDEITPQDG